MNTAILTSFLGLILTPLAAAQCVGDIAVDGRVDGGDLGVLLANWGPVTASALSHACDLDGNGKVDGADLGMLLANWGTCPPVPWANIIEMQPDPAVVTNPNLRASIVATGLPWRVVDRSTGIEMLLVPPGTFQMGCVMGTNINGCPWTELPTHQVTITNAYYLGRYEVTQGQWESVVGSNPSHFRGQSDSASRPVESVRWDSAQIFLALAGMRLPTEAEWEFACRAGTDTPYYNNSSDENLAGTIAWIFTGTGNSATHPVGQKPANGFGLHDMLGNVAEWVSDWWTAYAPNPQIDPTGAVYGERRIVRGGSYNDPAFVVTSSYRSNGVQATLSESYIGFRVARNP
jgi:formylglycine-generating enzyme required for sulfatase activity